MRKLISASKRKWVLGGILGFAAIALTTTGFATWIVGVNATTGSDDVTVTVDTVKNEGVKLTFELTDDQLVLGETTKVNDGVVQTGDEAVTGDMTVTAKIILEVGAQYLEENNITGIELSLDYGTSEKPTNRQNLVTLNNIGRGTSDNESQVSVDSVSYWEYINAPETIELSNKTIQTGASQNGLYTYTIPSIDLTFTWGSYFGKSISPANYYNSKFKEETVTVDNVNSIYAELKKMQDAFTKGAADTNNVITLTAKLLNEEKNTN